MSQVVEAENRRVDALIGEARPLLDVRISGPADLADLRQRWSQLAAVPVMAKNRNMGIDNTFAGVDIRTLLRGEQSAGRFAAHSVVLPPGAGVPAHYYEDTHTYVLVAEGEVNLAVGKVVDSVGQHSLGYVPPRTRLSFRNTTDAPVALAIVHSPAGAERAFAAAHEIWDATHDEDVTRYHAILARHGLRFDDAPLENDDKTNATLPPLDFEFKGHGDLERLRAEFLRRPALPRLVRTTPDEFDATVTGTSRRKELLNGDDSGGNAMLNLISGLPGFGAPAHHQPTEEEFFVITDGVLHMTCATETADLRAGALVFCPRNCTHGFRNETESETRFVTLNSPAGHERTMAAVRRLMQQGATKEAIHDLSVAGGFIFHSVDELG